MTTPGYGSIIAYNQRLYFQLFNNRWLLKVRFIVQLSVTESSRPEVGGWGPRPQIGQRRGDHARSRLWPTPRALMPVADTRTSFLLARPGPVRALRAHDAARGCPLFLAPFEGAPSARRGARPGPLALPRRTPPRPWQRGGRAPRRRFGAMRLRSIGGARVGAARRPLSSPAPGGGGLGARLPLHTGPAFARPQPAAPVACGQPCKAWPGVPVALSVLGAARAL